MKKIYQIPTISCLTVDEQDVLRTSLKYVNGSGNSDDHGFSELLPPSSK